MSIRRHSLPLRDFICGWESLRLIAYNDRPDDPARGVWTLGYGHTLGVREGDTCTREEAEEWLDLDLDERERRMWLYMVRQPTQQQFDAILSLAFNAFMDGPKGVGKSGLMQRFNAGLDQQCADRFLLWNTDGGVVIKGLTKRRMAEREIYLHGDYSGRP